VIKEHAFNSIWWRGRAGILEEPTFFELPEAERLAELESYEWVEFRCPLAAAPDPWRIRRAGFVWADAQIGFRIALPAVPEYPESAALPARFADTEPFEVPAADLPAFPHERFLLIPGATPERVTARYALWAKTLLSHSPEWCVALGMPDAPQGWFLAERDGERLHLALAMLHRNASISGHYLYAKALKVFAERGARLGYARFSIRNSPVHNVYTRLGAVFRETAGVWLWAGGRLEDTNPF